MRQCKVLRMASYIPAEERFFLPIIMMIGVVLTGSSLFFLLSPFTGISVMDRVVVFVAFLINLLILGRFSQYLEETLEIFSVRLKESLYLAANHKTKGSRLDRLSRDDNSEVRVLVAENPSTSATTIINLAEDDDRRVQETARAHPNYDFMKWAEEFVES